MYQLLYYKAVRLKWKLMGITINYKDVYWLRHILLSWSCSHL